MAKLRLIPPKTAEARARQPRACTGCGRTYHRRNLIEVWDTRNLGHRIGWHKTRVRLCLDCQKVEQSRRVLVLAHIQPVMTVN